MRLKKAGSTGNRDKDNINEPMAADTELEHSGSK